MTKFSGFFLTTKLVQSLRASFQYSLPSLKLAWRSSKKLCLAVALLTVITSALPLLIAYIGKIIIDAIVANAVSVSLVWVGIEAIVVIIQTGVLRFLFLSQSLLGAKLGADVNILILEKGL